MPSNLFPVVGIGASAGGLEAFSKLLEALAHDTGMAFVLVQHLDPSHKSVLAELLARTTSLPVAEITDGLRLEPNRVYVIPPNTSLAIKHGVLQLSPRLTGRDSRPIDDFLRSLASDQGFRAIGVILSGTASDGTLGLEAIQAEGGVTFAQDEASAKFASMPHSAAAAGAVDFVLPPAGIAKELARLSRTPYLAHDPGVEPPVKVRAGLKGGKTKAANPKLDPKLNPKLNPKIVPGTDTRPDWSADSNKEPGYRRILQMLHDARGVDFSLYRSTTIRRRIERRMLLDKIDSPLKYAERLKAKADEIEVLYQDLLIGVTSFFRDPHVFEFLQRKVFPELVKGRAVDDAVRIWVSGCSTGQEAYSLVMAYLEFAARNGVHVPVQIFATDLNVAKLERAKTGFYTKGLTNDLSAERLKRFFSEENGGYRISKSVRERVIFAHHNVFTDTPFSRMDVVSCRNLLIYLEPSLQGQVIPTFHYALKPDGVLVLGASETVGRNTDLFAALDKRSRVYTKLKATNRQRRPAVARPASGLSKENVPNENVAKENTARGKLAKGKSSEHSNAPSTPEDSQREVDRLLLARYGPAGVMIDDALEVVQFRGATGRFLEPPSGKASFNLLRMVREGLMLPLRGLIERAKKERRPVRAEGVSFRHDGNAQMVNLEVAPLTQSDRLLVLFELPITITTAGLATAGIKRNKTLAQTPDSPFQAQNSEREVEDLMRELRETRGYFQVVQEQAEVANEELQASNEEAQSSNEELQSLNEELETSKEELESSNEEMRTINEELTGRNTELRQLDSDHLNFQASVELAILSIGADLRVRKFTPQAETTLGLHAGDIGRPIKQIRHGLEQTDLEEVVRKVIQTNRPFEAEVLEVSTGRWLLMRVRPYQTQEAKNDGAVLVFFDIDVRKRAELERERLQVESDRLQTESDRLQTERDQFQAEHDRLQLERDQVQLERDRLQRQSDTVQLERDQAQREKNMVLESLRDGFFALDYDWNVTYANAAAARLTKTPLKTLMEGHFWTLFPEKIATVFETHYRTAMTERITINFEAYYAPFGVWLDTRVVPIETGLTILALDVTERHQTATALEETAAALTLAHASLGELAEGQRRFLADASHELRAPLTVIQGNLEMLERFPDIPSEERNEVVSECVQSVLRLGRMAKDLLALARGDAGDHLRLERLELQGLMTDTLHEVRHLASGRTLEAGVLETCQIEGDRDRLKQLLTILLDNALKYTPEGGTVTLELDAKSEWAEIRIADTGAGIGPDDLEKVFERFYRTDASRSRQTGGTGLGLPIARWIAEQHGGTVRLESELGVGTKAIVCLPLAQDSD